MSGFRKLLNASLLLDNSLNNVKVGAISFSTIQIQNKHENEWESIITNKLNDIKLLNSKAMFINVTVEKDNIQIDNQLNSDDAKLQLQYTISTHSRWNNALKTKAISRTAYLAYKNNDQEKIEIFKDLLQKVSNLDNTLDKLNEIEHLKNKELNSVSEKWQNITIAWNEKKKFHEMKNNAKSGSSNIEDQHKIRLNKLIHKMEVMKIIQGRLLTCNTEYDWIKNPSKLHKYLGIIRKPPYKPEDFL